MIIDYSTSIFHHKNNLYDQLNYNLHPCNYTNQYICYFNNSIFAVWKAIVYRDGTVGHNNYYGFLGVMDPTITSRLTNNTSKTNLSSKMAKCLMYITKLTESSGTSYINHTNRVH